MDIEPAPKEDLNSNKLSISFLLNSGERDTTLAETTTTIETNTTAWPWGPQETTNSNKDSEIDPSGELASSGLFLLAETTTTTPYLAGEKRRRKDDATRSAKRSKKEQEGFRLIAPSYKGETDGLGLIADLVAGQTQQQQLSAELPPLQPSAAPSYVLLPSLSNSVKERPRSPPYNNNNIDNIFSTGPWNAPSNPFFPPPIFSAGATSAFTPCTTQSLASPFPVSEVTADAKSRAGPKKGSASGPQIIRFSATPSTTTGLLNLVMGQQEPQQEQQQQQPQQCNQGKRNRWNSYQKAILEETFQDDPWPDAATKEQIAVKISMTPAQVATWWVFPLSLFPPLTQSAIFLLFHLFQSIRSVYLFITKFQTLSLNTIRHLIRSKCAEPITISPQSVIHIPHQ